MLQSNVTHPIFHFPFLRSSFSALPLSLSLTTHAGALRAAAARLLQILLLCFRGLSLCLSLFALRKRKRKKQNTFRGDCDTFRPRTKTWLPASSSSSCFSPALPLLLANGHRCRWAQASARIQLAVGRERKERGKEKEEERGPVSSANGVHEGKNHFATGACRAGCALFVRLTAHSRLSAPAGWEGTRCAVGWRALLRQ